MAVMVLRLDIGNMQEAIAADRKIHERGLDRRFEVHDLPLVDVSGVALMARAFEIKLFEDAVLDDGDSALLGLEHVDQHFFLHTDVFLTLSRLALVG
jgi:hypothetical protein